MQRKRAANKGYLMLINPTENPGSLASKWSAMFPSQSPTVSSCHLVLGKERALSSSQTFCSKQMSVTAGNGDNES